MKNGIRAVLCVLLTMVSAVSTYSYLKFTSYAAAQKEETVTESYVSVAVNEIYDAGIHCTYNSVEIEQDLGENRSIEVHMLHSDVRTMDSCRLKVSGQWIDTEPVVVDVDSLMSAYRASYEPQDWDKKGKINIIHTLWNFLVEQNGVDKVLAASIIGATMHEGRFAEEQGSYNLINDIEDARALLGAGSCGYGIAQWTYKTRQQGLLNYYELANEMCPDNWETACVVAECCMLLREIEAYGIFDDLYSHTTIEDAVGRMCLLYEGYEGASQQWSSEGGYHLISHDGSGISRLRYAQNIYDYYMED